MRSVSGSLANLLQQKGIKTIFGVPGAYSLHFVDLISRAGAAGASPAYILCSHEANSGFAAQGYAQVMGCGAMVTTAGPAALNTVTPMASAMADGDSVLLIHGEPPQSMLGRGALQDGTSYGSCVATTLRQVSREQYVVDDAQQFAEALPSLHRSLGKGCGPVHLMVRTDVFPQVLPETADAESTRPQGTPADAAATQRREARIYAEQTVQRMLEANSMLAFAGHGVYQAGAVEELNALLRELSMPTMVSGRGAATVEQQAPHWVGQYSIFPHETATEYLAQYGGANTDLLLVLGSSLGEYSSNSYNAALAAIPNVVHCNTDAQTFGRLGHAHSARLDVPLDVRVFVEELRAVLTPELKQRIRGINEARLQHFRAAVGTAPDALRRFSRPELLRDDEANSNAPLTGQRVVHRVATLLSQQVPDDVKVNVVADTGSAKLYAAHYVTYKRGWRCIQNSGPIDCLGFALSASIGASLASVDKGEKSLTVCFVGDGGLLMGNELNALAQNARCKELPLLIVLLNDGALSYVHQGFAAVMGSPLDSTRFAHTVDGAALARAVGLSSRVIERAEDLDQVLAEGVSGPLLLDCRISQEEIGPGFERYNRVRAMLGKPALSPIEMQETLRPASAVPVASGTTVINNNAGNSGKLGTLLLQRHAFSTSSAAHAAPTRFDEEETTGEVFGGGGPNVAHLYGIIYDVFAGCIDPKQMTAESAGVDPKLKFGLGVSSFEDDTADIGDAVYLNGRFFVRRTDEGEKRIPLEEGGGNTRVKERTAKEYRTSYSLGVTKDPDEMEGRRFVYDSSCDGAKCMRHMLVDFIGEQRKSAAEPNRMIGFMGLVEYDRFLGTSLNTPPTQGENILPVIDEYARETVPVYGLSGINMGFVRTASEKWDDRTSHLLYERMFFDNPRDDTNSLKEHSSSEFGSHWMSHTHGVLLPPGESVFGGQISEDDGVENQIQRLISDDEYRKQHLSDLYSRQYHDVGHVTPGSSLRRYLFIAFDVHQVKVFNPIMSQYKQ